MDNAFQAGLLSVFILLGLVGVGLFAGGFIDVGGSSNQEPVSFTVWGEWDESTFNGLLDASGIADNEAITVSYTSIPSGQIETRLVNTLARGNGPDVLLIPHTRLLYLSDLITTVGEDFYTTRTFRNNFIEASEIFLSEGGISALPLAIDPLVMYWNRDILTEAGHVSPPSSWSEVSRQVQSITETGEAGSITTSGIALGLASNVSYTKEILSSLFLQAGNNIVSPRSNNEYESVLVQSVSSDTTSIESAVGLFTQYANPATDVYTWNNSFSSDYQAFISGDLALYLAPASEIRQIRAQNPNLNFDVSVIPQLRNGNKRTYGEVYGFSILQQATNKQVILRALETMTGTEMANTLVQQTDFTPVRKDVISQGANDAYKQVFYDSAVIARGWLDPDVSGTQQIFTGLINDVTSGRRNIEGAVRNADARLSNLLNQVIE